MCYHCAYFVSCGSLVYFWPADVLTLHCCCDNICVFVKRIFLITIFGWFGHFGKGKNSFAMWYKDHCRSRITSPLLDLSVRNNQAKCEVNSLNELIEAHLHQWAQVSSQLQIVHVSESLKIFNLRCLKGSQVLFDLTGGWDISWRDSKICCWKDSTVEYSTRELMLKPWGLLWLTQFIGRNG